jgi:hypothetical protein
MLFRQSAKTLKAERSKQLESLPDRAGANSPPCRGGEAGYASSCALAPSFGGQACEPGGAIQYVYVRRETLTSINTRRNGIRL